MPKIRFFLFFWISLFCFSCVSAQPNYSSDSSRNAQLFKTIRSGNVMKLKTILEAGADANAARDGYSALMAAALNGNIEEMKLLIKQGANINYCNSDSISALWLAVPDYDKTELLISKGANVNQRSREGNNVLIKLSAIPGSAKLMQLLINKGCDVLKSSSWNNALYNAAGTDDTAIVGLLIRYGVSVNDTSVGGDYPINSATNYRCFNTLKMLVDKGADVNVSPKNSSLPFFNGITPLMWTAVSNDKPSFYYLLRHGADAAAISPRGYTTLMLLAMSDTDDPDMTKALIEHGALPSVKAKDGTDALYYARLKGNTQSVNILSKYIIK